MSIELKLREINATINAISNTLNNLDNYNKKDRRYKTLHTYLAGQFSRELRRFRAIVNSKPATRSHYLAMQPTGKKLYRLERKLYLKYPNLPIHNFMEQTARYRGATPVKKNTNKAANNRHLNRHEFVNHYVNDLPKDAITLKNIKSGNRAIKINKSIYSLQSFRNLSRSAVYEVLNRHGNSILFVDPMTRQTVRRSQITPIKVKLRNPNRGDTV
tara:strand:+ start:1891 stop:2535 length:645 start_codon:yes stop_codon:yes gene_type:complete